MTATATLPVNKLEAFWSTLAESIENGEQTIPEAQQALISLVQILQDTTTDSNRDQTAATISDCRICYARLIAWQRNEDRFSATPATPTPATLIPNGIYTISMADGDYITLRLKDDWRKDATNGSQCAYYLFGPNNERDYTGFAFVKHNQYAIWGRHKSNTRLTTALAYLLSGENYLESGILYAQRSGNCWHCGRTLTVPASLHRGLGPVCAVNLGIA